MSTATPAPVVALPDRQEKFIQLEDILNEELVERSSEIRGVLLALISGQHVFFLGTPGVAKTYLFLRALKYIEDARSFKKMLMRNSTPHEVFGPPSLQAIKEGRYENVIDGFLPDVELAFIDEIWKANSPMLNSLLEVLNERTYTHGNKTISIPLSSVFSASNELPENSSLAALYDRFLFRFEVKEIQDSSSLIKMLKTAPEENPAPVLSWADIAAAKEESATVEIPDEVYNALADIQRKLRDEGIHVTSRHLHRSLAAIKAAAWLDGETVADLEHLRPLQHVLWERPEQITTVTSVVATTASPLDAEALDLLDEIQNLRKTCERLEEQKASQQMTDHEVKRAAMQEFSRTQQFMDAYGDLETRAKNRRRQSEPMQRCHTQLQWLTTYFMNIFGVQNAGNIKGLDKFGA